MPSGHHDSGAASRSRTWLHDDLDVAPEQHEESDEPVEREPREPAANEGRHLRLVHLEHLGGCGRAKNVRTRYAFKKAVRILKRVENAMVTARVHQGLPSYFIECLGYNCPDSVFGADTWTEIIRNLLVHVWAKLDGDEPDDVTRRWVEVNECFYLFHDAQKWKRADGRAFAGAAWAYLGYS